MNFNQFEECLQLTWQTLKNAEHLRVLGINDPTIVRSNLNSALPLEGQEFSKLLADFRSEIVPSLNLNTSPFFGAYITGSGNPIGALAEFIKGYYNQNGLKWNNSPIASELEQLVVKWIAEYHYLENHRTGFLTSGGSMSNFMGLHLALAARYPEREHEGLSGEYFTVYCSDQTHSSIDRAMVFLGLGRNQLRKIPVDSNYQVRVDEMRKVIEQDLNGGKKPLAIVGNAGTTNTGSIDDLSALADIATEFDLWYHVDGAYGLPAIRLDLLRDQFHGIEKADSIIINPHKWLYVPFEASSILLKEIPQAIHFSPDYLFTENPVERWESSTHTIELSKEFRALKIWFTLKYFGVQRLTKFVKKDIEQIKLLATELSKINHMVVEPHHPLSILCFRYENPQRSSVQNEEVNINALRKIESEGEIFITGTKLHGKTHLRVYYGNPERTDQDVIQMARVISRTLDAVS